jgi:Putative peptidoglycan binding domain
MKFHAIIFLMAIAAVQSLRADDDQKSPSRPSTRPVPAPAASTNVSSPRGQQSVNRRPVNALPNPSLRPTSSVPAAGERRVVPSNRVRPLPPSSTPVLRSVPNRTAAFVTPNQRPNSATRTSRSRIPQRAGNDLTFSQARSQCSQQQHHDREWWRHHHRLIVFYGGGYWFWNAGWWFPAWGYSPYYNNYAYDGPIYGAGELSPGDVTAQVQEALAQQGYYYGAIDGVLGPDTRDALLRYQADHGLATTAAIDEPTLDSLGLT